MKKTLFVLFAAFTATLFILTSFAHSGGTDSQGGHHKDNGDYHYHHGYPAHDHYDTNEDGIADYCPYDYEDDTKHNQGGVAATEKESPYKNASNTFDIGKFLGNLIVAAIASYIPAALISGFLTIIFEKYMSKRWDKVFIVVYILTTIMAASILNNA